MIRLILLLAATTALAACGPHVVTRDRAVAVLKPVPQPCAERRPAPIARLRELYSDDAWAQMDPRQKAAAIGKQLLERQAFAEALDAATASCP